MSAQDSEKLTDAELAELKREAADEDWGSEPPSSTFSKVWRLILESERHRTPSVPGEDMLKRARDWLDKNPGSWLTSATASLATELSLAREEERERCAKVAEDQRARSQQLGDSTHESRQIAAAIRDGRAAP